MFSSAPTPTARRGNWLAFAAVLAAARELVAAGGGSALNVGAVARRAGVSRLTIYNRFGSRSELLRAVVGEAHARTRPPAANGATDPR